jgi:hypothetical protein
MLIFTLYDMFPTRKTNQSTGVFSVNRSIPMKGDNRRCLKKDHFQLPFSYKVLQPYAVQLKTMPKSLKFQLSIFIQNLCKLLYHRVEEGGMDSANSTREDKRVSTVSFMASEINRMTPNRGTSLLLLLAGDRLTLNDVASVSE